MSQKQTTFRILGQPVPCPRPRVTRNGVFYPPKYRKAKKEYADFIRLHFAIKQIPPFIGPVCLRCEFIHQRPKAMKGTEREWKTTRPDLDNLIKSVKDAISAAGGWGDDSQVVVLFSHDLYAAKGEAPHTNVYIEEISGPPKKEGQYTDN